jgi:hypothetical protein
VTPRLKPFLLGALCSLNVVSVVQAQPAADVPAPAVEAAPAPAPAPEPATPGVEAPATEVAPPVAAPPVDPPPADPTPPPADPPPAKALPTAFKIEAPNGSSLKIGMLMQPQFQAAGDETRDSYALNLYVKRTRVLLGGNLFGVVDYFFDTEYANLFFANNVPGDPETMTPDTSVKNTPGMNILDAFVTYKAVGDALKIDAGYMLPAMAHNALQGATTLYSWDYFVYSFRHSNSFQSSADPTGRDAGVQLRGLVLDDHLEYRIGLFQGLREGQTADEVGSQNFFRTTGRLQINLLDPEPGFFYAGTYLGTKSVFSIGGSFDIQDEYKYFAGDVFADVPVGPGVVTAQVNVAHWDGGDFVDLPNQTAVMAEAGFTIDSVHLSPIVRFEKLWVDPAAPPDQTRLGLGLAYWAYGHNFNLKAFYTRRTTDGADHAANLFNVQAQFFVF